MRLSELKTGESATILKVLGHGGFRRRIMEMGFVRSQRVEVLLNAPLEDPIEYRIMGYDISLRRSEAEMIVVLSDAEVRQLLEEQHRSGKTEHPFAEYPSEATDDCRNTDEIITRQSRIITVALVGNPNSGKTSLFNAISGGREHVGNYSGVTVGAKLGYRNYRGYRFEVTDLPGTYALSAYTPEERFVRRHIAEKTPDVIINSVVASNLERNLYLTTELIDINPRMVVALNMYDELNASGAKLDYDNLGRMLGVPMVPVEARNRKGIDELLNTVIDVYENRDDRVRHIHINQGPVIEEGLQKLNAAVGSCRDELPKAFPPRYYALKLLEGDREIEERLNRCAQFAEWTEMRDREARRITEALGEDVETAIANQKYGFISGALKETYTAGRREEATTTALIDTFVTHKLWGFPIFFLLMGLMFWCTFNLGAYPQEWLGTLVGWIGEAVDRLLPAGVLRDLLADGVIGGVGSVIVFLPNIMILYLFISFMEDSGYLARAAFIMDRVMHRLGLHGKSFIPLIMGFGCNVPAIMASRTIESRSSRLITILITPFMSCSARIPIYLLLAGTFFGSNAIWVMTGLYLAGVLVAILTARLMRRFLFPVDETPFVMELPPYRLPTWKTTLAHMWDKCAQYLQKMGGMILVASIVVWFSSYYPRPNDTSDALASPTTHYENSYLGRLGKACEPVFRPLGLNWKAGVALLSGVPAKEIVVSTLGVLYSENEAPRELPVEVDSSIAIIGGGEGVTEVLTTPTAPINDDASALSKRLVASGDFTTASALAFLVFILLYFPCIATVAAIGSEAGWKWAVLTLFYNTGLAWIVAWAVYHLALWI
ncbi:MAG: ferrous iron transport protein B [Alistipes sp.]|nr:ferrous iron transport protein B [Alistipes sp.]